MVTSFSSPTIEARRAQAFPRLSPAEIERMRRFGVSRRYADGERLFETGKASPGLFVVLSGTIRVTGRDGHGHDLPVVDHGPGAFSGELGQLSGRRSFVDGTAQGEVEALLIVPERLHALLVGEAALGEAIMRALILRRVGLLETGAGGPVIVGDGSSADVVRLRNFLARNGVPHVLLDRSEDPDARALLDRYAPDPSELPLVVCPDGTVLRNPPEGEVARCIGMLDREAADRTYDVAVVGAGPAGLAAAVYAASEGLTVKVVDARSFGGQAGASARIENYLGFPTGISGQALAARAYTQAQKFGAEMAIPEEATGLLCDRSGAEPFAVRLASGGAVLAKSVIVASGARYRRPDLAALRELEGHGVWYWASPIEAKICAGQEVVLVGGGNSAGQAAVFLSGHARRVWMLVRGPGLAASMSRYLIERIEAIPNVTLLTGTEIAEVAGSRESGVESVTWRSRAGGASETRPVRNVFLFLGADPSTEWLRDCDIALDAKGFVKTGADAGPISGREAARQPLETTIPGVFAIGDVRLGSVKRVGGAIGEGAAVVAQVHAFFATASATA